MSVFWTVIHFWFCWWVWCGVAADVIGMILDWSFAKIKPSKDIWIHIICVLLGPIGIACVCRCFCWYVKRYAQRNL